MLRSPHAHARIVSVDARAALALPGVFAVSDRRRGRVALRSPAPPHPDRRPPCPTSVSPSTAPATSASPWPRWPRWTAPPRRTRSSESWSTTSRSPPSSTRKRRSGPTRRSLYPELGTNVVWHDTLPTATSTARWRAADGVLRERFAIQRYASTPLETFGGIAEYDAGTDVYEFWTNDQRPGLTIASARRCARRAPVAHPALLPGHRRRLRQQAAPRLPRDLRAPRPEGRAARQVDRGPHREPHARSCTPAMA